MGWIKRLIMSRYVKSFIRYLIVALVVYLNRQTHIPFLDELVKFLEEHNEKLVEILSAILIGWVGTWTALKNAKNAKIEKETHREVK